MKGTKHTKTSKVVSKRKRANDDEEGDEEKPAPSRKTGLAPKRTKTKQPSTEDVEMKPTSEDNKKLLEEKVNSDDELAEINGVKPLVVLEDGEETEVGSATR